LIGVVEGEELPDAGAVMEPLVRKSLFKPRSLAASATGGFPATRILPNRLTRLVLRILAGDLQVLHLFFTIRG
jgi:hypothetical protein